MSEFDPIAYLNSRFRESLPAPAVPNTDLPAVTTVQDKASELLAARQAKLERLQAWQAERKKLSAAKEKSYDDSVIGMLGLDRDGVIGTALNTAVGMGSGLTNIAANIGTSIHALYAAAQTHGIPEEARTAYGRWKQGAATEADMAILNGINQGNGRRPGVADAEGKVSNYGGTNFQRLQAVEQSLNNAQSIRDLQKKVFSDRVYRGDQQDFEKQLVDQGASDLKKTSGAVAKLKSGDYASGSMDLVSGLAGLFANVGSAALDNPKAALSYVAENAAQLALAAEGGAGMALTNLPYAMDAFGQGIEEFRKKNGGALPSNEELVTMAGKAASLALAETVGDKVTLGADKLTHGATKAVQKLGELTTAPVTKEALKKALNGATKLLTDSAPVRVATNTATGALGEFATEGYQTFMEENIKGNEASAEDIYKGAAAGALAGGGIAGSMNLASEVGQLTSLAAKRVADKTAQQDAMEIAVKTGDTSAFLDPASPSFDPHKALQSLVGNGTQEAATPEDRKTNLEKATPILSQFQKIRDRAQAAFNEVSPESSKELEADLASYKEMLSQDPTMTFLQPEILATQKELDRRAALASELPVRREALTKATQDFEKAQALHTELTSLVKHDEAKAQEAGAAKLQKYAGIPSMAPEEVAAQVKLADSPVDTTNPESVKAASKAASMVISLAMASPGSVSVETAQQLAGNMNNGLTEAQRNYLRAFSSARLAHNLAMNTKGVQKEVLQGDKATKQKGIADYEAEMAQAVSTRNKAKAQSSLTGLTRFAQDHASKLATATEAMALFEKTGKTQQIYSNGQRQWEVAQVLLPEAERRQKGGLEIDTRSKHTLKAIKHASLALNAAAAAHQAAFDLAFKGANSGDESQVQGEPAKAAAAAVPASRVSPAESQSTPVDSSATPGRAGKKVEVEEPSSNQSSQGEATHFKRPDSTQQSNESEQAAPEKNEEAQVEPETPSGKLSAYQENHPEGASYTVVNLITEFFTQTGKKEGNASGRPLVEVGNFLQALREGKTSLADFLEKGMDTKQEAFVNLFLQKAQEWDAKIEAAIKKDTDPAFRHQDMLAYLVNPDGSVDQNVKTAIALAAFLTISENIEKGKFNTDKDINAILMKGEDEEVSEPARRLLQKAGMRRSMVINSAGQKGVQALGLRSKKGAPQDVMPRLEAALGAHAVKLLAEMDLIEHNPVSRAEMTALMGSGFTQEAGADNWFIRPSREKTQEEELTPDNQEIKDASKGTLGILDKLFGTEPAVKVPSLTPIPFTQKTTRNTRQGVPAKLAKIIERQNAQANFMDEQKWNVVSSLSRDTVLAMSGFEEVDDSVHVTRRDSVQAKNEGLERDYDRMKAYVEGVLLKAEGGLKNALYFSHNVWKQQRVGIETNALNPQTSKLHRHLIYKGSWETKVDTANEESFDNFRLRVLEGLGVKTDKKSNATNLSKFDAHFDPDHSQHKEQEDRDRAATISTAIDALVATAIYGEGMNPHFDVDIREGVKAAGEGMHSFDALMAMAQYRAAKLKEETTFTTRLMGEIDGVTNGPMLSHLLLGAASSASDLFGLLNRGGFFEMGNEYSQYNQWREVPLHRDLYENTTAGMLEHVRALPFDERPVPAQIFSALFKITGNLEKDDGSISSDGRNIIKTPLTAMVFGSSMTRAVESMAENFVAKFYERIEQANKGKLTEREFKEILEAVNTLILHGKAGKKVRGKVSLLNPSASVTELMEAELTKAQTEALKEAFRISLGRAVRGTMEENFGHFMESRKTFNEAAEVAFKLYNAVYTGLRESFIQKEIQAGNIAVNATTGDPLHDLTDKQEAEFRKSIKKAMPVLNTFFSSSQAETSNFGLFIGKSARRFSYEPVYKSENRFANEVKGAVTTSGKKPKSMTTRGYKTVNWEPGVGMLPMGVHSSDSAISHLAAEMLEVLNIHDAHGSGLKDYLQAGKNLNASTFKVMLNYSPAREMQAALDRVIKGTAEILAQEGVPVAVKSQLAKAFQDIAEKRNKRAGEEGPQVLPHEVLGATVTALNEMVHHADRTKYEVLSQLAYVDQYALEGGHYEVTPEDRQAAADMLAAMSLKSSVPVTQATDAIVAAVDSIAVAAQVQNEQTPQEEEGEFDFLVTERDTAFGKTGKPTRKGDASLEEAFTQGNLEMSARDALRLLNGRLSERSNRIGRFHKELVQVLAKRVPKDLKIRLVTPKTDPASLVGDVRQDPAWFNMQDGNGEIYVLSSAFKNSYLTEETLLHELVHAGLASAIHIAKNSPNSKDSEILRVQKLVAELELLREEAAKLVATLSEEKQAQFAPAIGDVQELVPWGLTNPAFMSEVLNKVSMKSATRKSVQIHFTGFMEFISKLVGILFKDSTRSEAEIRESGLTLLVENTMKIARLSANMNVAASVSQAMAAPSVAGYTTQDIFEALGSGTVMGQAQERHLKGLLVSIVNKLHGPAGVFKAALMQDQALTPVEVFAKTMATGEAPFASELVGAPFALTEQERFVAEQVEATLRAALLNDGNMSSAYAALTRLYKEAYTRLEPKDFHVGDWNQASQADKDAASEKRDFLFKLDPDATKRSNHLARFAALAMVSPEVRGMLTFVLEAHSPAKASGFFEKLEQLFKNVLSWFEAKVTKSFVSQQADKRAASLVSQLIDIEAKRRDRLQKAQSKFDPMAPVDKAAKKGMEVVRKKVAEFGSSKFFKQSKYGVVRATGSVSALIANDRVNYLLDAINEFRNQNFKGEQQGFLMGILNDVRGPKALFEQLLRLSKHNENLRKKAIDGTGKLTLSMFRDNGKKLTAETKNAITQIFLRSGAHVLLDDFSMQDIANLLSNPKDMDQAIKSYTDVLAGEVNVDYYENQSKVLGYYLATGKTRGPLLMLNAGNIARLLGTRHSGTVAERDAQRIEKTVDVLSTLYALKYNKGSARYLAQQTLLEEMARTDNMGNGVEGLLHVHRALEEESRDRLFSGNETLMQKAYVPEIVNPHVELRMVTEAEGRLLEAQGFTRVHAMSRDNADTVREGSVLYARNGGGQMPWQTGIMSYTGLGAKGTESIDTQMTGSNAPSIGINKRADIDTLFTANPGFDPAKDNRTFLAPIMDGDGNVSSWRYLMEADTRDNVLERNSQFDQVMGKLAGSIVDKETTQEHNSTVVKALHEEYLADSARNMDQFLLVGEDSTDPQLQQIYRMLPEATRREIEDTWGMKGMRVRVEMIDLVFGYRKLTLSSAFDKAAQDRTPVEAVFVGFVEGLATYVGEMKYPGDRQKAQAYAKRAGMLIRKGERAWQEIVKEVKDVIVIRTGTVLLWNVVSNMTLLAAQGVGFKDMARHHAVAYKSAAAYQRDSDELDQLKGQIEAGYVMGGVKEVRRRITELEDAIARNPVRDLIEAGMLPSIVEDVETEEDPYSYKTQLTQKLGKYTSKVNPHVMGALKHATVARGTPLYNFLHRQTQLSDFVARYTLYQHLTTRKENPLSRRDALHQVSEAFINYDIPMHRTMQYIDDMGLGMFNKYFFRIQRVLLKTSKENPARVLAMLLMKNYLVNIPTVLDSSAIHHIGNNPFSSGALQLPFLMDDLLTSKLGMGLLK